MITNAEAHESALADLARVHAKLADLEHLPDEMGMLEKRYDVASQALKAAQTQRDDAQQSLQGTSAMLESARQELAEAMHAHAGEMESTSGMLEAEKAAVASAEALFQGGYCTGLDAMLHTH